MALQVNITGGIGSGKSVVCQIFGALGIPVYDADSKAKQLVNQDFILRQEITKLLGETAFAGGVYNRAWVAAQVFDNPALLQQLNGIIHPRVFADSAAWLLQHQNFRYVVRESALINKLLANQPLVVVTAPVALRVARIKQRDPQRTDADIQQIIARQATDEARLENATHVIKNDETQLLLPQVWALHQAFLAGRG